MPLLVVLVSVVAIAVYVGVLYLGYWETLKQYAILDDRYNEMTITSTPTSRMASGSHPMM